MDDFLSKYGWLVVAGIVIAMALGMASTVSKDIKDDVSGIVDTISGKIGTHITTSDEGSGSGGN